MPKLPGKITRPYRVKAKPYRNKYRIKCRTTGVTRVAHVDHLKKLNQVDSVSPDPEESQVDPADEETEVQTEDVPEVPRESQPGGRHNLLFRSVNNVAQDRTENAQGNCRHCCPVEAHVPRQEVERVNQMWYFWELTGKLCIANDTFLLQAWKDAAW